ncbi:MAG TPA: GreA/GreB family elongation factor [Steroidobacteraceae bacterium]
MSRAFVKESDDGDGQELPELQISPHRNLVTPAGMRQIETTVERLQSALSEARAAEDRAAIAWIQRDLRYWSERQRTAEAVPALPASGTARFGYSVTLEKADGKRVGYQIVGEDEADPSEGRISYVSPIARKLLGAAVGDEVGLADGTARIVEINQ